MADPVSDPADVRVMIPRFRRAVTGPFGSGFIQTEVNDSDSTAAIADAIGDVILYSGSAFGKELEVVDRDSFYMSPVAWRTSSEMTPAEQAVVIAQAALNWFMRVLSEMKTSERFKRADEEWEWTRSAQALAERIRVLRAARDEAIQQLETGVGAEAWINTLLVRDQYTDVLIEPWVSGGVGGQLEIANPDFRFGTTEWLQG